MKAKEEYVDAPRETRSKDITVYAIIFLVLLVGAGIFLAFRLLHKPADAALADSKSGIIYDSSAVEGGWDNLSPEEIAEKLNEKVAEGMINISMNTAPYFENGTAEGNVMIVNEDINLYRRLHALRSNDRHARHQHRNQRSRQRIGQPQPSRFCSCIREIRQWKRGCGRLFQRRTRRHGKPQNRERCCAHGNDGEKYRPAAAGRGDRQPDTREQRHPFRFADGF